MRCGGACTSPLSLLRRSSASSQPFRWSPMSSKLSCCSRSFIHSFPFIFSSPLSFAEVLVVLPQRLGPHVREGRRRQFNYIGNLLLSFITSNFLLLSSYFLTSPLLSSLVLSCFLPCTNYQLPTTNYTISSFNISTHISCIPSTLLNSFPCFILHAHLICLRKIASPSAA